MRMDQDRLVRKVLRNGVQLRKEYGYTPDPDVEKATEIARDREKVEEKLDLLNVANLSMGTLQIKEEEESAKWGI